MHLLKSKTIKIFYLSIFFIFFVSINNKNFSLNFNNFFLIEKINFKNISKKEKKDFNTKFTNIYNKNIFELDREKIKKLINSFHIVHKFEIKKIYPNQLDIDISKTKIVAKIIKDKEYFIGRNGKLIENYSTSDKLPYIFGNYEKKNFLEFLFFLEKSPFKIETIDSLYIFPSGRFDLLLNNGILIKLPKDNPLEALKLVKEFSKNDKFKFSKIFDLRNKNVVYINE